MTPLPLALISRSRRRAAAVLILLAAAIASVRAAPPHAFFAMDNIARGGPDVAPALLKELGYAGYGGRAFDEIMPPAVAAAGLTFFNGYGVLSFAPAAPAPDEKLRRWLDAMAGRGTVLWLAIQHVAKPDGARVPLSDAAADEFVAGQVRAIADYARRGGTTLALYPHTGFWLARVEDALRLAERLDRPDVGVTFNLCHWLKVEGSERDPAPVLRAALPRLKFVTINGADTGDTKTFGWDRLIQPLDRGSYDVPGFVRLLGKVGYTGPVGFQGYGIKEEPRAVLARTMAAWRAIVP